MKVTLKGKIKFRGDVKVKRTAAKLSLKAMRKIVRAEMNRGLNRLRAGVRRDLRNELYSQRFSHFISDAVRDPQGLKEIANENLNKPVDVLTTAGPVAGILVRVGTDYMVIQESPSAVLIVPFNSTLNIRPQA